MVADIKSSQQNFRKFFRDQLNIDYIEIIVRVFESKLALVSKPIVESACQRLTAAAKQVDSEGDSGSGAAVIVSVPDCDFRVGTKLFELYLAMKQMQLQCHTFPNVDLDRSLGLDSYHMWFLPGMGIPF